MQELKVVGGFMAVAFLFIDADRVRQKRPPVVAREADANGNSSVRRGLRYDWMLVKVNDTFGVQPTKLGAYLEPGHLCIFFRIQQNCPLDEGMFTKQRRKFPLYDEINPCLGERFADWTKAGGRYDYVADSIRA